MKCTFCGMEHDSPTVGFKAICASCDRYLHTCVQCRFYDEARKCISNTTELVRDPEGANFCEEFQPINQQTRIDQKKGEEAKDKFNKLFG